MNAITIIEKDTWITTVLCYTKHTEPFEAPGIRWYAAVGSYIPDLIALRLV